MKIPMIGKKSSDATPRRLLRRMGAILFMVFVLPVGFSAAGYLSGERAALSWWQARSDSSDQAPDPSTTPEAVVQVYAASAFGWRGIFGVHTWIVTKSSGADRYTRFEVLGWGVRRGRPAVRVHTGVPDGYWHGSRPQKIVDLRGPQVDELINRIQRAANHYPYRREYRLWPGPNSNTFTAYIGRKVPELRLDLPPTAIGKDYLANGGLVAPAPSGTGVQFSLYGLAGILIGKEEGIEINLLGLTFGIDVLQPALKLPGLGRIGIPDG